MEKKLKEHMHEKRLRGKLFLLCVGRNNKRMKEGKNSKIDVKSSVGFSPMSYALTLRLLSSMRNLWKCHYIMCELLACAPIKIFFHKSIC